MKESDYHTTFDLTQDELWILWFWFKYVQRFDSSCLPEGDYPLAERVCKAIGIPFQAFNGRGITKASDIKGETWAERIATRYIRWLWKRHARGISERKEER